MADVEEAPRCFVNNFQELSELVLKCKNRDQPCFVSVSKHSLDHLEGVRPCVQIPSS